ncbi:MAG: hypothetical protein A2Z14_16220 [Chloroflexi bacterium RBG_16_48_8]|nr:MAG: hypothetical protein A2Z14_16220 [Chloroflexi bacterium RBG_16_48_8]
MEEKKEMSYRSLFWPILLIGLGTLWLLANLGILPDINWKFFLRLWPLILIIIGLDIIIGRRTPLVGALLGLGVVAALITLVLLAPSLNLEPEIELKTLSFSQPLESATSARINLHLERYATTVDSLSDSTSLIEADLDTLTDVIFNARGAKTKSVSIEPVSDFIFDFDWTNVADHDAQWDIYLSPYIPIELIVEVGSGSATLNLSNLELTDVDIDGGSGSTDLFLPASTSPYTAIIDGGSGSFYIELENRTNIRTEIRVGSGSFDIVIGSGSDMEARIEGGSGSLEVDVPSDVGVRIEVRERGSGSVNVPTTYDLVDDIDDNDKDTGIWETDGYANASRKIEITFDPGSGSLEVR